MDFVRWVTGCNFAAALDVASPEVSEAQALREQAEQYAAEGDPQPSRSDREFSIAVRLYELALARGFEAAEEAARRVDALLGTGAVGLAEEEMRHIEGSGV